MCSLLHFVKANNHLAVPSSFKMNSPNLASLLQRKITRSTLLPGSASIIPTMKHDLPEPQVISGSNAYAVLSSPRSAGAETIVISASWISRTDEGAGTLNLRGIATVLSLAAYLKRSYFAA